MKFAIPLRTASVSGQGVLRRISIGVLEDLGYGRLNYGAADEFTRPRANLVDNSSLINEASAFLQEPTLVSLTPPISI
jgi:hypothetical protein